MTRLALFALFIMVTAGAFAADLSLENAAFRYTVAPDGRNVSLIEKASGRDLLSPARVSLFGSLQKKGAHYEVSRITAANNTWTLAFGDSGVEVVLSVRVEPKWMVFEVVSMKGEDVDSLTFLDVPLQTAGTLDEPAAACLLALNLKTNVPEYPGPMKHLEATAYARFGIVGAKAALLLSPTAGLREVMKEVVTAAEDLPHSALGGPWALDAPINRGSYLIEFEGNLGEATVDTWIALAKNLGMSQIDFHTGKSMRFGDLAPDPKVYPNGLEGVKAVVDKLHAAGIKAGLHTYAFFIAKDSEWVSPAPDKRLAIAHAFTLADDVSADAKTLSIKESTEGLSAVTGFQVRNSATVRIDDELIEFGNVQNGTFTECKRGACGTRVSAHTKGAKVEHLKECFGLFVPDGDSTLFAEVAARTAEVYNRCGFDMIYLDALDGADIISGGPYAWYYGSKFVFELEKTLQRPALFEMSTFTHHLWYVRSRMGAWDVPARAFKRYVDIHSTANEDCARRFLPAHLGWWGAFDWNAVQPERMLPDDIEYLCGKCLGNDCGLSLLVGFTPETWAQSPNARRLGSIIRSYEELRLAGKVPERVKASLRVRGDEFTLEKTPDGKQQFRRAQYDKHAVIDEGSRAWTVTNRFGRQPAGLRIEALMSASAYDDSGATVLAEPSQIPTFSERRVQEGVTATFEVADAPPGGPKEPCVAILAKSEHAEPESAWALAGKTFAPQVDVSNRALGVWVYGDGQGEIINVQLKSSVAAAGGISEHYIKVDFTGWRYCLLVEPESYAIADWGWPYSRRHASRDFELPGGDAILDYNIWVNYGQIEQLNLWLNGLPVGKEVRCFLGPIKSLPLKAATLRNPRIVIGAQTIMFPVALESGQYIEFRSMTDCHVYDAKGNEVCSVTPEGAAPTVEAGDNKARLEWDEPGDTPPGRARVTVITVGEALAL